MFPLILAPISPSKMIGDIGGKIEALERTKVGLQEQLDDRMTNQRGVPAGLRANMAVIDSLIGFYKDQLKFWQDQLKFFIESLAALHSLAKQSQV